MYVPVPENIKGMAKGLLPPSVVEKMENTTTKFLKTD